MMKYGGFHITYQYIIVLLLRCQPYHHIIIFLIANISPVHFILRPYSIHCFYGVCSPIKFFSGIHFSSKDIFKSCTHSDEIDKQNLGLNN